MPPLSEHIVLRNRDIENIADFDTYLKHGGYEALRMAEPSRQVEFKAQAHLVVAGDLGLLRIALENLLGNAWKFTRLRVPAKIEFGSQILDGKLTYFVRDNGVGLSAARLTDFNRGVGLANTRSRLQHLYGSSHRFEFRQPPTGGLSVLIAIPLVETAEAAANEVAEGVA